MDSFKVPLIIRGELIEDCDREFGGRKGGVSFFTPDINDYFDRLVSVPLDSMREYQGLSIDEVARFLGELGAMLSVDAKRHLHEAFQLSCHTSGISAPVLEALYRNAGAQFFDRDAVLKHAESTVGIKYLEGWVPNRMLDGSITETRAFGARSVHVIAGNSPAIAFMTVVRAAITRSDCIAKVPSNDPLTFGAILRTMIELDAAHPVTRHMASAYWKGGDVAFESRLYRPEHVEKIIAWGGFDSIQHIVGYLRPGLDLITMDPKQSASIIGRQALADDETMRAVAQRAACDIGAFNQELCANARVLYVECDHDDPGELEKLNRFGVYVYEALQNLPQSLSTRSKYSDVALNDEIDGLFLMDDWYRVHREDATSGGVIVSQTAEPVEFAAMLGCRTANIVPLKSLDDILRRINAATQTVGVYPLSTKKAIRDQLALRGAQIIVSLGYVARIQTAGPVDGMEPERRMCKWLVDQSRNESLPGPWVKVNHA